MTTQRKFTLALLIVIIIMLFWYFHGTTPTPRETRSELIGATGSATRAASDVAAGTRPPAAPSVPQVNPGSPIQQSVARSEAERQKGLDEWRTPIAFYGKVLDENTNAVQGAQIEFACNDLSETGTSFYHTESDVNGLFSIQGIRGKMLVVKVNKVGFYPKERHGSSFFYAGENQNFVPEAGDPVIFHLRRKGELQPLRIHSVLLELPQDDTPLVFDPLRSKLNPEGPMVISLLMGIPESQRADARLRVTVRGGGIQSVRDEFPFLAPADGYQESLEFTVSKDARNGADRVFQCFFFMNQPRIYGRLRFELETFRRSPTVGKSGLPLTYWVNASGSRNLESNPSQYVQPVSSYYLEVGTPFIDDIQPPVQPGP